MPNGNSSVLVPKVPKYFELGTELGTDSNPRRCWVLPLNSAQVTNYLVKLGETQISSKIVDKYARWAIWKSWALWALIRLKPALLLALRQCPSIFSWALHGKNTNCYNHPTNMK